MPTGVKYLESFVTKLRSRSLLKQGTIFLISTISFVFILFSLFFLLVCVSLPASSYHSPQPTQEALKAIKEVTWGVALRDGAG